MELIKSIANGVCTLKLNRPEVFNSFNRTMALQLQEALDQCELDDNVRAIVITGEGKAFCAGQDLAEAVDPEGPELTTIVKEHYNPIMSSAVRFSRTRIRSAAPWRSACTSSGSWL